MSDRWEKTEDRTFTFRRKSRWGSCIGL